MLRGTQRRERRPVPKKPAANHPWRSRNFDDRARAAQRLSELDAEERRGTQEDAEDGCTARPVPDSEREHLAAPRRTRETVGDPSLSGGYRRRRAPTLDELDSGVQGDD